MGIISKDTLALIQVVRDGYPKTWEWVRHKANWECTCVGAIFENYNSHIKVLMEEEKLSV